MFSQCKAASSVSEAGGGELNRGYAYTVVRILYPNLLVSLPPRVLAIQFFFKDEPDVFISDVALSGVISLLPFKF
jgi:hypothetical protein